MSTSEILIIAVCFVIFVILPLIAISVSGSDPISRYELDESTHYQMRKQKITEEEIKEFMGDFYDGGES